MAPVSGELRHGYSGFAIASLVVFALSWAVATVHYQWVERRFMALRAPRPQAAAIRADSQKLEAPAVSLS